MQPLPRQSRLWRGQGNGSHVRNLATAFKNVYVGTSLVAQWLRIRLPMQGHGFEHWSGKIPRATSN